jgi:hypothetical protein
MHITGVANRPLTNPDAAWRVSFGSGLLISIHIIVCCLSLVCVTRFYASFIRIAPVDEHRLLAGAMNVAPFALVSILFVLRRFSFGYVLSFYLYTIILGYLWLLGFSRFPYDHLLAYSSAFVSGLAFFLPAMFITSPIRQRFVLSADNLDRLLSLILILALILIAIGATFNLKLAAIADIPVLRNQLVFPAWLTYAIDITATVLLPFAFACFVLLRRTWRAGLSLLLQLPFYLIILSKFPLLAPVWLLALALSSRYFSVRVTVVLSLLFPMSFGILLQGLFDAGVLSYATFNSYFSIVNFRMVALPSSALDFYNDFFSNHDLTHFCQIGFLKRLVNCPYQEQLGPVMQNAYNAGNFNASLLATEGIASIGLTLAPLSVLACGLVVALGNCVSSELPPRFILLSSGMLMQVLMTVPFTISMVTYGGAVLFLLWYVTPRSLFDPPARNG